MEINVTVGEIDLNTVVGKKVAYHQDYDGDYEAGEERDLTLGDVVREAIVNHVMRGQYPSLANLVAEIRTEMVREAAAKELATALAKPYRKTNAFGEPRGEEATLAELMFDHVQTILTKGGAYREGGTVGKVVQEAVTAHLVAEWGVKIQQALDARVKEAELRAAAAFEKRFAAFEETLSRLARDMESRADLVALVTKQTLKPPPADTIDEQVAELREAGWELRTGPTAAYTTLREPE